MDVYGAGRSYEADLLAQARKQTRGWQFGFAGALVVAGIAIVVAATTVKLHTVTSHVVTVDKVTGMAEVLSVTTMRDIPLQGVEAQAWARRYVENRERYFFGILQVDYNEVIALSDDDVARGYDKEIREKESKFGNGTEEHFKIINVTLPPDQVGRATVRFEKRTAVAGRADSMSPPRYYIATVAYRFVPSPIGSKETLSLNPLGFKVSAYVVEQELGGQR